MEKIVILLCQNDKGPYNEDEGLVYTEFLLYNNIIAQ